MASFMQVMALHRYFIQADRLRCHFDELLAKQGPAKVDDDNWTVQFLYMGLWYGCLRVVAEGWQELGLSDTAIDELIASPNLSLLQRFRNAVFHYQKDYWSPKFLEFVQEEDSAIWVRTLNAEFSRWFLAWPGGKETS
jgi:hypothetical protein